MIERSDQPGTQPLLRVVDGALSSELAAVLRAEDAAQAAGLSPFERVTCPVHRGWAYRCISASAHVIQMTGHRWCADCQAQATVAVDELTGRVTVRCVRCGGTPAGYATTQIIRTCQASLARAGRTPALAAGLRTA
jgi:hypothetical protein